MTNEAKIAAQYNDKMLDEEIKFWSDGRRLGAAQRRLLEALIAEKANRS